MPSDVSSTTPAVDLQYHYAAGDSRVLKTARDAAGQEVHTAYIFPSLELRRAEFDTDAPGDYTLDSSTEVAYLFANGVRLARLVHQPLDSAGDGKLLRVFFELGDHLGSTSVALDKDTGELVERSTYQDYGGAESSYRPSKWGDFREDYRFTGKEEDVEVGLTYFGKRFYNALLQRWVSPDPLEVHEVGSGEPNVYAYISGQALRGTDPMGLECGVDESCADVSGAEATSQYDAYADDLQPNQSFPEPPPLNLASIPKPARQGDCHGGCDVNPPNAEAQDAFEHFALSTAGLALGAGCAVAGGGTGCMLIAGGLWTSQATGSPDAPQDAKGSSQEAAVFGGMLEGAITPLPKTGSPTLSGRLRLTPGGDTAIRNASKVKPLEGHFDVVGHGLPDAVIDETGALLAPAELAERIRSTPSWEGQKVHLLSCSTGACESGFAQQLANKLGVDVLAPTEVFEVSSRGNIAFPEGGGFVPFKPQEASK